MKNLNLFSGLILLSLNITLATSEVYSQELSLFESTEGEPPALNQSRPETGASRFEGSQLRLSSVSRFGEKYVISLQERNGEMLTVNWYSESNSFLPGYAGYSIINVRNNAVIMQKPANDACIPDQTSGISCIGVNTEKMELVTLDPLVLKNVNRQTNQSQELSAEKEVFGTINPFDAALISDSNQPQFGNNELADRAAMRAERLRQFEPVRVSEQEVPPGMRIVRTPFGDRLVPERE